MTTADFLRPGPVATLRATADRGLRFLAAEQRRSGEFPTYRSSVLDFSDARPLTKVVYTTTFVVHALSHLPTNSLIETLQRRSDDFLAAEQANDGSYSYYGPGSSALPPDLDDLSCAVAARFRLGHRPSISSYTLLWKNETRPGGPYLTWLGLNGHQRHPLAGEIDALVNANVLFCCGLLGLCLPGTEALLGQMINDRSYQTASRYSLDPPFLIYAVSRASADGRVASLAELAPVVRDYILTRLPPTQTEVTAFNLACLTVGLLNLEAATLVVEPYLEALLGLQQPDGRWPGSAAWRAERPDYHGSPALTTALALEAIAKFSRRV